MPDTETRIAAHFVQDDDGTWVAYVSIGDGDNARIAKHIMRRTRSGAEKAAREWADEYRNTPRTDDGQTAIEL
jgi:hypothetical protein